MCFVQYYEAHIGALIRPNEMFGDAIVGANEMNRHSRTSRGNLHSELMWLNMRP